MITKTLSSVCISLFLLIPAFSSAVYIEELPYNDMYTFVYHQDALQEFSQTCSTSITQDAKKASQQINQSIQLKMDNMKSVHSFLYAHELYQRVSSVYPTIFAMQNTQKCYYGYILTSLQSLLREHNITLIEKNNIMADFANISGGSQFNGDVFKLQLIKHFNQPFQTAQNQLPTNKRITQTALTSLSETEQTLAEALIKFSTNMVYDTINDMYNQGFISKNEVDDLIEHININYIPNTCTSYHGRFGIVYQIRNGHKTNPHIDHIDLNINGCYNIFVLSELEDIIKKLTLHEIGGHMSHYIKDTQWEDFQTICRSNTEQRNSLCSDQDFVSPYAQTNAFEDYAETFAHRWLGDLPTSTPILQQKVQYMENMKKRIIQ